MHSLKLIGGENYYEDESEESCEEIVLTRKVQEEPIEQEYLDFAEKVMQAHGADPEKIAKAIDTRIGVLLGGFNADTSREAIKQRLAEVYRIRSTEPWEETGFAD